jgi:hypothetical protein
VQADYQIEGLDRTGTNNGCRIAQIHSRASLQIRMVSDVAQERHRTVLFGAQRWRDFDNRASKAMNPLGIQMSVDAATKWGEACHFLRRK